MIRKIFRVLGIFYILLGSIILLNAFHSIIGFTIIENIDTKISSFLGIIFIALGLLTTKATREKESVLEKKVSISVYNARRGNENDSLMMTDPELYFENSGAISLGRFTREITALKEGQGGKELVQMVKDEYEPALKKIAESEDAEKASIAERFLKVLDSNYHLQRKRDNREENYELSREEREEIKNAFRSYDGRISTEQKEVMKKYNLMFDNSGSRGEAKIRYPGIGYTVTVSRTPSDRRAGLNMVRDILDLIEKGKKHDAEKRSKKNEGV